jgi:hypothetical protein
MFPSSSEHSQCVPQDVPNNVTFLPQSCLLSTCIGGQKGGGGVLHMKTGKINLLF